MTGWSVSGDRNCVRLKRPGGIVVGTLDTEQAFEMYQSLKAIFAEDPEREEKLQLLRLSDARVGFRWRLVTAWRQLWGTA